MTKRITGERVHQRKAGLAPFEHRKYAVAIVANDQVRCAIAIQTERNRSERTAATRRNFLCRAARLKTRIKGERVRCVVDGHEAHLAVEIAHNGLYRRIASCKLRRRNVVKEPAAH